MGLFSNLFPKNNSKEKQEAQVATYFKTLEGYTPHFTTFKGGLYEMDLTRSIIRTFARHCGKLKPEVLGPGNQILSRRLQNKPNPFMSTPQFLERLATIYEIDNSAFIVPIEDKDGNITGVFPVLPSSVELKEYLGRLYIVYEFGAGKAAIEFDKVGIIVQDQYKDDFFGESNTAMDTTLDMLNTQNEGIVEAIKQSAHVRFIAKIANVLKEKDLIAERKRLIDDNLSIESGGGVMMIDQKYESLVPINSSPWMVDSQQMNEIKSNAFNYFGCNEKILQNSFTSSEWNSYYEGKIEPFAIKVSIALTNMFFTEREQAFGNEIMLTTSRMQYLSNEEKLNTVTQLFDRGMMTTDQGLEVFNLPPLPDGEGQKRFIRKEYIEYNLLTEEEKKNNEIPLQEVAPAEDPAEPLPTDPEGGDPVEEA